MKTENRKNGAAAKTLFRGVDEVKRCCEVRRSIELRFESLDKLLDWAQRLDRAEGARRSTTSRRDGKTGLERGPAATRKRRSRTAEEIELLINGEEVQRLRRVRRGIVARYKDLDEYIDSLVKENRKRPRAAQLKSPARQQARKKTQ